MTGWEDWLLRLVGKAVWEDSIWKDCIGELVGKTGWEDRLLRLVGKTVYGRTA